MKIRRFAARLLMGLGALTLLVLVAGGIYAALAIRRGFSARDEPSALERWMAGFARAAAIPERATKLENPVKRTPEVLAGARAHWADHCALCHANNGSGETIIGKNLFPKAPDMRRAPTQRLTDGQLYYIIKNGVRLTGMPAWGELGENDHESWGLVAFIRHLPAITTTEEREMKGLNPKSAHEMQEKQHEDEFLDAPDKEEEKAP